MQGITCSMLSHAVYIDCVLVCRCRAYYVVARSRYRLHVVACSRYTLYVVACSRYSLMLLHTVDIACMLLHAVDIALCCCMQ